MLIDNFINESWCISPFYEHPIFFDGMFYPCLECAFQASKTDDVSIRAKFQKMQGQKAKAVGDKIKPKDGWAKLGTMYDLNELKFKKNPMRDELLSLNGLIIAENYGKDNYFGVYDGYGKNMLGRILMHIRADLKKIYGNRKLKLLRRP